MPIISIEEKIKKEALSHFSDVFDVYKDVKSKLRSPSTRKALGDIRVKTEEGEEIKATKSAKALPSTSEIFIKQIRKKIEGRKEIGYEGDFQKNVEPKLRKLSEESGRSIEELTDMFFEVGVQWLNGLEELGTSTRNKLLDHYRPEELVGITKDELQEIKGVGEKRAEKILTHLPI